MNALRDPLQTVMFEYNGFVFIEEHLGVDAREAENLFKIQMGTDYGIMVKIVHPERTHPRAARRTEDFGGR